MDTHRNTIVALSTPPGEAGLAVVRVSGPEALGMLSSVYRPASGKPASGEWEHRRLYHGTLVGDEDEIVDEVMCAVMRAPDTYTGEDMVEITCHGGTVVVSGVVELFHGLGAGFAGPGEFTKRAFLNGKMDLIQAEAVADLIHARSNLQKQVAHKQLGGGLSRKIGRLADQTLELLGVIEANIDFIEEDIDTLDRSGAALLLDKQLEDIKDLLTSAPMSKPFREGFRVAIAGPVNAGKSSLFNRLVGEQRAIVTDIPGTTRDVLREPFLVGGLLFVLQDTAGLRGSAADGIEAIGVGLAEDAARTADVVLFVIDSSRPVDRGLAAKINELDPGRTILALNKTDLAAPGVPLQPEPTRDGLRSVRTSALTGDGLKELEELMVGTATADGINRIVRERVVLNGRLVSLLKMAAEKVSALRDSVRRKEPLEIMAVEARDVLALYEEATGRRYQDGLLDTIFSKFCIGK